VSTTLQGVGAALANGVVNPNEKEPMTDEFSLSLERELRPNFAVRATGIYSRTLNTWRLENLLRPPDVYSIPVTNPIPTPNGTGTTGASLTYYNYPSAFAGTAFQKPTLINDPSANATYKSFELAATKRLANRWQFMASYSATKKNIPIVPNAGTVSGLTIYVATDDPNALINNADNNWEWLARASGAYNFRWDVLVAMNFESRSGTAYARQALFTGGQTIPSITLNVEPIGSQRLPEVNLVDFRIEKAISLTPSQKHKAIVRLNIFNALNTNAVTNIGMVSGASYGLAQAIVPPRIFELSATYRF
jgi:hypothetical protein